MSVCQKFPNESRHETALRYIREREQRVLEGSPVMIKITVEKLPTIRELLDAVKKDLAIH